MYKIFIVYDTEGCAGSAKEKGFSFAGKALCVFMVGGEGIEPPALGL